jgi:hypothetical protein
MKIRIYQATGQGHNIIKIEGETAQIVADRAAVEGFRMPGLQQQREPAP